MLACVTSHHSRRSPRRWAMLPLFYTGGERPWRSGEGPKPRWADAKPACDQALMVLAVSVLKKNTYTYTKLYFWQTRCSVLDAVPSCSNNNKRKRTPQGLTLLIACDNSCF